MGRREGGRPSEREEWLLPLRRNVVRISSSSYSTELSCQRNRGTGDPGVDEGELDNDRVRRSHEGVCSVSSLPSPLSMSFSSSSSATSVRWKGQRRESSATAFGVRSERFPRTPDLSRRICPVLCDLSSLARGRG